MVDAFVDDGKETADARPHSIFRW